MEHATSKDRLPDAIAESQPYLEPWMRGTHGELDPLRRAVLHALELSRDDAERKLMDLSSEQIFAEPYGLPSVGFHLRHMVRSLDRLLTYAEGGSLTLAQMEALAAEGERGDRAELFSEFHVGLLQAAGRVIAFPPEVYAEGRGIGRKRLPTTVGGLLVHCAEHTQRHAGQAVTTAKLVRAMAGG